MMTETQQLAAILTDRLDRRERNRRQGIVHEFMLRNSESIRRPNFEQLSCADLGLLFQVTDEQFFQGKLCRACETTARPLKFRLSRRMTTSGGMTTMQQVAHDAKDFEIAIATTPLFQSFQRNESSKVGGRVCRNRLQALQRIMEHEMIHLAEMLVWDEHLQYRFIDYDFAKFCTSNPLTKRNIDKNLHIIISPV